MAKLVLDDIGSTLTNTAATTINNNNNKIEQALENTLSRDGSTPNNMQADIDMDSNDILNAGAIETESLYIDGRRVIPGDDLEFLPDFVQAADTRTELAAVNFNLLNTVYLKEEGRTGTFIWRSGDFTSQVASDPNQGLYIASNRDGVTPAVGAWVRQGTWAIGGRVYVEWFRSGSDTATIQAAFNSAPEISILTFAPKKYTINNTITHTGYPRIDVSGLELEKTTSGRMFSFVAQYEEVKALSANYVNGALTLSVNAMDVALKPGEVFKIFSNAVDGADRDSGSNATQYRQSEWLEAAEGCTTTLINLKQPIRFPKGVDPTSTVGDEALIDSYTTAMNARVFRLKQKGAQIWGDINTNLYFTDGMEAVPWVGEIMRFTGHIRGTIEDIGISRGYGHGISLGGCYGMKVVRPRLMNLEDNTSLNQLGYGVADASYGTVVDTAWVVNCRHGYTSSVPLQQANDTNAERVLSAGRTVGGKVVNSYGVGSGDTNVGIWDTHHSSEDTQFINCHAENSGGYGFNIRGRNIKIINPTVVNCQNGINIFTEFAGGDPDDDNWVARKDADYFTSCTIINPRIECGQYPITTSHVTLNLEGDLYFRTTSHVMINNVGSAIKVTGSGDLRQTTLLGGRVITADAGKGIFHIEEAAASTLGAISPNFIFAEGSDIFASCFTATGAGLAAFTKSNNTNTLVIFRGRMNVRLATTVFTQLFNVSTGFSSSQDSTLIWAMSASAGNSITLNVGTQPVKVEAADGTCWYDNTGLLGATQKFSSRNVNVNVTHTGTGAMVEDIWIPGMPQIKAMDAAGHYFKVKAAFVKGGSVGAGTLRIKLGTAFVADIPMLAADRALDIEAEVYVQAASDQRTKIVSIINDAGGGTSVTRQWTTDETVSLAAATFGLTFGANIAVGDTLKLDTYTLESTVAGFGYTA